MAHRSVQHLTRSGRVDPGGRVERPVAEEHSADGFVLADALSLTLLRANSSFLRMANLDPADLPTHDLGSIFEGAGCAISRWAACAREAKTALPEEALLRLGTGEAKPVEVRASGLQLAERPCVALVVRDVSERRRTDRANRASEDQFDAAVRDAYQCPWEWDLRLGIVHLSDRWWQMLGYATGQTCATVDEWQGYVHPEERERFRLGLLAHLSGHTPTFQIEIRMLCADGGTRWLLCCGLAQLDEQGGPVRIAGSLNDIPDWVRVEPLAFHDARRDSLTGLPNRAAFLDRLSAALERARRHAGPPFAVLLIDLDRFTLINDSLGHPTGNEVLMAVARRVVGIVRSQDMVARLDGDEFAVLLEEVANVAEATSASDRIQAAISSSFSLGEQEVFSSVSVGIAMYRKNYASPEEVLRDADTALYRAKSMGRDRHVVFQVGLRSEALAIIQLESSLRNAMRRQELRLVYQPILALDKHALQGFEALIRWQHPTRGRLTPDQFLPLAEETGLIIPIGAWVLHEAALQAHAWQAAFPHLAPLTVSVNISSRQFAHPDLAAQVESALAASGLEPSCLVLEITESVLIQNASDALGMLEAFASKGIRLALDDFGTGYSALSYLQRFPFTVLKMDPSFISALAEDLRGQAIVQAILTLADNLGLEVVAEGVERHDQEQCLRELGCRLVQGYLYSRPMDPETATAWLQQAAVGQA